MEIKLMGAKSLMYRFVCLIHINKVASFNIIQYFYSVPFKSKIQTPRIFARI